MWLPNTLFHILRRQCIHNLVISVQQLSDLLNLFEAVFSVNSFLGGEKGIISLCLFYKIFYTKFLCYYVSAVLEHLIVNNGHQNFFVIKSKLFLER